MKKYKFRKWLAGSVAVFMTASLCACASDPKEETKLPVSEDPVYQVNLDAISPAAYNNVDGLNLKAGSYISIIGRGSGDSYWNTLASGVKQAADDINEALGYTGNDKVKVTYNAPDKSTDIDDQVNILDEELSRYPDVIGIASVDAAACQVQFDLATESDIPIVAFDSSNNYDGILCVVKTDNISAAAAVADNLSTEIKDSGSILILSQDSASATSMDRVKGFTDELQANHPNILIAETLYNDKMDELKEAIIKEQNENNAGDSADSADAGTDAAANTDAPTDNGAAAADLSDEDVIQYYLEKHPDVRAIYTTNTTTTQLAVSACKQMNRMSSTTIVGFDAGRTQLDSLKNGEVQGLLVQNPFGMGYATVVACARTILEQGNEAVVNTGYTWVTKDNMDDEAIANLLYE
ncbi:MAG: substrate-binding domain-containing protein [Hespellia sp.]|nr:substrate-binding domain-containing protein [Hespellia sp.]